MKHRRGMWLGGTALIGVALLLLIPFVAQGATAFASPAFQQQWNSVESVIPNFWGPLATARDGQTEPYAEGVFNGQPGNRLVQYFDKARMEQTNPDRPVTNGLLTVELKSGQLQLGDNSFQPRNPSFVGIAGDPDVPGPTYASLALLPEKDVQRTGTVSLAYDLASKQFIGVNPATDPATAFTSYQTDPGGRYGQNIPKAFWDFMQSLPGPGWLAAMGYPISPAFATNVRVNGVDNTLVYVQAFERRVLTYTPNNAAGFKVEFGNIGQHYFRWRYTQDAGGSVSPASTSTASTSTALPASTPSVTASPTVEPVATGRGNPPTVSASASSSPAPLPSVRP
jgi:hypothetical protein